MTRVEIEPNNPCPGRAGGRGCPRGSRSCWTRVTTLTPVWTVGMLALGAGVVAWVDSPAVQPARCLLRLSDNGPVKTIGFREDGGLVLATDGSAWRISGGNSDRLSPVPCGRAAFSRDGALLAVSDRSKVTIIDVDSSRTKVEIPTATGKPLTLAFSPASETLAVPGERGVILWDIGHGPECEVTATADVISLVFSPGGRVLAMGDRRGVVRLWEVSGRRWLSEFRAHAFAVTALAFSPDGKSLVTASPMDTVARAWDVATSRPSVWLRGHSAPLQAVAFAPSGRVLATAGREGDVRLWDAATGREGIVASGRDRG